MALPWHLYVMALLYVLAGINHFRNPTFYIRIIPPFFSNPVLLNQISGLAEVILGLLLIIPWFTPLAAWGIIIFLMGVFPSNLYMAFNKKAGQRIPKWLLYLRLPMQFALIAWAYQYTRNQLNPII